MGLGDEVIATRHIRDLHIQFGYPVIVRDKDGARRWHDVWAYNPRMLSQKLSIAKHPYTSITNGPGCRPYIMYEDCTPEQWVWNRDYRIEPGEIYLSPYERLEVAKLRQHGIHNYIVIDPYVKGPAQINKDWGFTNYQELVKQNSNLPWLQFVYGPVKRPILYGVRAVNTRSVRALVTYLSAAAAVVCNEGGLHHCAAALGIPAVVMFGGFIPPTVTGYNLPHHYNLGQRHEDYCGRIPACQHCKDAMDDISVEQVSLCLKESLGGKLPSN